MLKITGSLCVILSGAIWGISKAAQLKRSVYEWEKYIAFLQAVTEELQCTLAPAEQIIISVSKRQELQMFFPIVYFCKMTSSQPFPERWEEALNAYSMVPKGMRPSLNNFKELFGAYQTQTQLEALKNLQENAQVHLQQAKEYSNTHGRMYSTLGLLFGLGTAILML